MKKKTQQLEIEIDDFSYMINHIVEPMHATWWSHIDEANVRHNFWKISKNDLVIDIGAAYGSYTLTALAKGASKVYAWAPEAGTGDANEKEFLDNNLKLNNWQDKAIVYDTGLFNKNGWLDTTNQNYFETFPLISQVSDFKYLIRVNRLDDWYQNIFLKNDSRDYYNKVWLKIDVEGAEIAVFESGPTFLKELKPIILCENHLFKDRDIDKKIKNKLIEFGYTEIVTAGYDPQELHVKLGTLKEENIIKHPEIYISHSLFIMIAR